MDRSGTGANELNAPIPVLQGFAEAVAVRDVGARRSRLLNCARAMLCNVWEGSDLNKAYETAIIAMSLLACVGVAGVAAKDQDFYGTFKCAYVEPERDFGFQVGDEIFLGLNSWRGMSWISALGPGEFFLKSCERLGGRVTCEDEEHTRKGSFDERDLIFYRVLKGGPDTVEKWQCQRSQLQMKSDNQ